MIEYFYSFEMCITRRGWADYKTLSLMDVIARDISGEENGPITPSRHTEAAIARNAAREGCFF